MTVQATQSNMPVVILKDGAVPLNILEKKILDYIGGK